MYYNEERINHMNRHIDEIKANINNYHDVYCFFDRMSLGQTLTVYCGLEYKEQDKIFCEYPSDDPIQQVDINNVNISSSIALSKDGAIYELQTK